MVEYCNRVGKKAACSGAIYLAFTSEFNFSENSDAVCTFYGIRIIVRGRKLRVLAFSLLFKKWSFEALKLESKYLLNCEVKKIKIDEPFIEMDFAHKIISGSARALKIITCGEQKFCSFRWSVLANFLGQRWFLFCFFFTNILVTLNFIV